jgi:hypothetical protein
MVALARRIKKDMPYTPNISEICIICNVVYWEYPTSSHGNPVKRKDRIYSSATHRTGIIMKFRKGYGPSLFISAEKTATKSAKIVDSKNKTGMDKYKGRCP